MRQAKRKRGNNMKRTIYRNYKDSVYMSVTNGINLLMASVELEHMSSARHLAETLVKQTFRMDGYTESLFDLGYFTESDFDKLWTFTQLIRLECTEYLD